MHETIPETLQKSFCVTSYLNASQRPVRVKVWWMKRAAELNKHNDFAKGAANI